MRRILICGGVLGGGTALVFGAAALTAVLIPPGRIVPQNQQMILQQVGGFGGPVPIRGPLIVTTDLDVAVPAPEPAP
jgi:hypothetical protein